MAAALAVPHKARKDPIYIGRASWSTGVIGTSMRTKTVASLFDPPPDYLARRLSICQGLAVPLSLVFDWFVDCPLGQIVPPVRCSAGNGNWPAPVSSSKDPRKSHSLDGSFQEAEDLLPTPTGPNAEKPTIPLSASCPPSWDLGNEYQVGRQLRVRKVVSAFRGRRHCILSVTSSGGTTDCTEPTK